VTWGKLDDAFWRHPKVKAAARRDYGAVGLFAMAISLTSEYETDGLLSKHDVEELLASAPKRRRAAYLSILLECGLLDRGRGRKAARVDAKNLVTQADTEWFELDEGALQIHDYLDFNRSKARLEDERSRETRKKRTQRARPRAAGHGHSEAA
jgi:hypothetical protein